MRISDWSSDVCSSDLTGWLRAPGRRKRLTSRAYVWKRCRTRSGNPHSPVRPHQAAVQALDGGVLVGHHVDRRVVRIARQQANAVLADLQQLDGDLLVDAGDDDLPGARVGRAVHSDQVAVEDALVAHRVALA